MQLNINTDAAVKFTNKLEKISRSALPVTIRQSLDSAAFDVKQRTMLETSSNEFVNRQKNFFKSTSRVEKAKGFDINTMKSTVGFIGGNKNQAVADLEKQERGGVIGGRSFIPIRTARISKSDEKTVSNKNKISKIKRVRNIDKLNARTNKSLLFKVAHKGGVNSHIIYKDTLFRVDKLDKKGLKLAPLYSYKKSRKVKVSAVGFMRTASLRSGNKIQQFYIENAKRNIKKYTNK